jgi:hypothetical protein
MPRNYEMSLVITVRSYIAKDLSLTLHDEGNVLKEKKAFAFVHVQNDTLLMKALLTSLRNPLKSSCLCSFAFCQFSTLHYFYVSVTLSLRKSGRWGNLFSLC